MKKIILLIPLILLTGCTNKEKIFETSAQTYYENHMKMVSNMDEATITLEDLENAQDEDGYDLKKLSKCDKQSKITFKIEKGTKNIQTTEIELKC